MKTLKLYVLRLAEDLQGYDCQIELVVRAKSSKRAREIAAEEAGDEGRYAADGNPWFYPEMSSCRLLKPEGKEGIVVRRFDAG